MSSHQTENLTLHEKVKIMNRKETPMNEFPLMKVEKGNKVLFHPHIPKNANNYIAETLSTRWIGQGPKVDQFEIEYSKKFCNNFTTLAVGSGTDALHLAYLLAGLKPGDEVISALFTCTATNIPLLYMGVKIKFADVQSDTLNIDVNHVRELISDKTKAIVCVHYGGLPCDMDELHTIAREYNIPIIEDAAHAIGAEYKGQCIGSISDFTMFSFQAIKGITTGEGGMLAIKDSSLRHLGEKLRWFGIDRSAKQNGVWENDIVDIGYKYQMNDIAASMGLAALEEYDETLALRKSLFSHYVERLKDIDEIKVVGKGYTDRVHAGWMMTVLISRRKSLMETLRKFNVESGQVHYRNDRYSIFGSRTDGQFPNMDDVEDNYLVLPLHTKMTIDDVDYICDVIQRGW